MKILVIVSEALCRGFALTGIDTFEAGSYKVASEEVSRVLDCDDYALVIVDENYMKQFDEQLKLSIEESNVPLVVSVPGEMRWQDTETKPDDNYISQLIRNAIGYQLNKIGRASCRERV